MTNQIILDLNKSFKTLNDPIKLRQGETAVEIQAMITENSKVYNLNGLTAELHIKKPNAEVYIEKTTIKDNKIICNLNNDVLTVPGKAKAYFQLNGSNFMVTTETFNLQILRGLTPVKKKDENEPQPVDLQMLI